MKIIKIISGGQTGVDQGGLLAARILKIPTGGYAPKGYLTENGPQPLLKNFGLKEHPDPGYPARTGKNVLISDVSLIFSSFPLSGGSFLTARCCNSFTKPYHVTIIDQIMTDRQRIMKKDQLWLEKFKDVRLIVNVSGSRESKHPGIQEIVKEYLVELLALYK